MIDFNDKFFSNYLLNISASQFLTTELNQNYINPIVSNFFKSQSIKNYTLLDTINVFNDLDYNNYPFDFFYDVVLGDICRLESGVIEFSKKYVISFDKFFCNKKCSISQVHYNVLLIKDEPILYFIYIDFEDLIKHIRLL